MEIYLFLFRKIRENKQTFKKRDKQIKTHYNVSFDFLKWTIPELKIFKRRLKNVRRLLDTTKTFVQDRPPFIRTQCYQHEMMNIKANLRYAYVSSCESTDSFGFINPRRASIRV